MRVSTRSTVAACVICSCVLIFIPLATSDITPGATSTKYTNEDHHDRLPSQETAQRLQVQHDQDQRRATFAGAVEGTDTAQGRFYDAASWSDDDMKLLKRLLGRIGTLLPHVDVDILHAHYQEAAANIGDHQRQPRRRLTEEENAEDIGVDRRLRKRDTRQSKSKPKSKNSKKKGKWDDEATVYWGSKSSHDNDGDTSDDWYAKTKNSKKKRVSDNDYRKSRKKSRTKKKRSEEDSRKSRKQSHKINDHDYSDSDDKRSHQKKKDAGSNKKKTSKSSFQPHFGQSFRDSQDEVDLFHGIVRKKKKKGDDRKKSSRKKDRRILGGDKSSKKPTS